MRRLLALAILGAVPARSLAQTPAAAPLEPAGATIAPAFEDAFGPRTLIEEIVVRGNRKTKTALIRRFIGLHPGDVVTASDRRVEAARYRLLSLGFFLDVRLSLAKGSRRGRGVLVVEVEERGTAIVNAVYLGTSEATQAWGGLDVAETNAFGRGVSLGGGFVASTRPDVAGADHGRAFRLRAGSSTLGESGIALSGTAQIVDGSEFFRSRGTDSEADPADFVAVRARRAGGVLGASIDLSRTTRLFADSRFEAIDATLPGVRSRTDGGGALHPIDFQIPEGRSRVASLTVTLDIDTRSDPVLPHSGGRLDLSIEASSPVYGSSYGFAKGLLQASIYRRIRRAHVIGVHVLGGAIFGDAPYFDRFFVGDLNFLLPPRALGINYSTLPSRNFLDTPIAGHRYDDFAGRLVVEYIVPVWRRRGFVYGGDFFAAAGVLGLASLDDLRVRDRSFRDAVPVDLTADLGLRLDTYIGIFSLSVGNALGRAPF